MSLFGGRSRRNSHPPPGLAHGPSTKSPPRPKRFTPLEQIDECLKIVSEVIRKTADPTDLENELEIEFERFRDAFDKYRIIKIMSKDGANTKN